MTGSQEQGRGANPDRDAARPEHDAAQDYAAALAAMFGLDAPERVPLWAERVRLSQPDIERLRATGCPPAREPYGLPAAVPPANVSAANVSAANVPAANVPAASARATASGRLASLANEVAAGRIDPVARVRVALDAMAANRSLNAVRCIDAEGALDRARELRERAQAGRPVGRLAGVLVAVKDCFHVAGLPSTSGTRSMPVEVPGRSTLCIERLQREDAIVVAMTTMHELAYGATTDNPHFGRVHHPDDPARLAGGSSGGSAVAVATGAADVALGTDTAGSVRMPAAICGVSGFKPTYGLVPTEGMLPLAWSLDHVGTFGTSAADHVLLTEVMGGLQAGTLAAAAPAGIRASAITNYVLDFIDPEVRALYESALERLQAAGVQLAHEAVQGLELAPTLQFFTLAAEAAQVHEDRALRHPEGLGDEVRVRLESGRFVRAVDYIKAQRLRGELHDALASPLSRGAHVLVTPAVVIPAPLPGPTVEVGGKALPIHPLLTRCTLPFNLTGMPSIAVPCGRTRDGLPVAIQLAAGRGEDALLLAIAQRFEEVLGK